MFAALRRNRLDFFFTGRLGGSMSICSWAYWRSLLGKRLIFVLAARLRMYL